MNATDCTESKILKQQESGGKNGGQKLALSKKPCSSSESKTGESASEKPKVFWITRLEACAVLECHVQTLHYREKKGEITGRKFGRQKFYDLADVEKMLAENPVASRPYKPRKRKKKSPGGGPGSGHFIGPTFGTVMPAPKPTLWQRISALFS
jgi:hypothetical protein